MSVLWVDAAVCNDRLATNVRGAVGAFHRLPTNYKQLLHCLYYEKMYP